MVAPRKSFAELVELATRARARRGRDPQRPAGRGDPRRHAAGGIRDAGAKPAGVRILSINALQRFNDWNDERAREARALARYAQDCGAAGAGAVPGQRRRAIASPSSERLSGLREALRALAPILADAGIIGPGRAARLRDELAAAQGDAVEAIEDLGVGERFRLVHDTFHHLPRGRAAHVPGLDRARAHLGRRRHATCRSMRMRDEHRVPGRAGRPAAAASAADPGAARDGYGGPYSFEPFAASVHA